MQRNWSGNVAFAAARRHQPETVAEIQAIVGAADKISVVGAGHSFSEIADTSGDLVSLSRLGEEVHVDQARQTASMNAGMRYEELGARLHQAGCALPNLASLVHVTVAGACATATHGSGDRLGNLASAVRGFEMVTGAGDQVSLSVDEDPDRFRGAVVNLGALGVMTEITLNVVPTYYVQQQIYNHLPLSVVYENFDAIMGAAHSVSLFTDWQEGATEKVRVKHKLVGDRALTAPKDFFGAKANDRPDLRYPDWVDTPVGVVSPWYEALPHFHFRDAKALGDEFQTEYFVPRDCAVAALRAVEALREQLAPIILITEIRSIAADDLWMSPSYHQDTVGIHFSWRKDWTALERLLPVLEAQLDRFDARPHWGKLFKTSAARLNVLYERMTDFRELLRSYDPNGKLRNRFVEACIFPTT